MINIMDWKEFLMPTKKKIILMFVFFIILIVLEHLIFILPVCTQEKARICDIETNSMPTIHVPLTCIDVCTNDEVLPIIFNYYPKYFILPLIISYLLSCFVYFKLKK